MCRLLVTSQGWLEVQQRPVSTFLPRHLGPRGDTHPGPLHTTGTETFLGVFKDLRRKEKMGANE